jgi:hypothetical protein
VVQITEVATTGGAAVIVVTDEGASSTYSGVLYGEFSIFSHDVYDDGNMQMLHVQFETIMQKKRRKKKCVDVSTWVTNGKGRGHVDDATGVGAVQFLGPPAPEFDRQSRTSSPVIDGRSGMMPPARARRRRADALDGRCGGVVWVLACGSLLTSKGSAPFYRQRQGGAGAERRLQSVGERAKRPASLHRAAGEIQILNSFFYPRTEYAAGLRRCVEKLPEAGPAGPSPFSAAVRTCAILRRPCVRAASFLLGTSNVQQTLSHGPCRPSTGPILTIKDYANPPLISPIC